MITHHLPVPVIATGPVIAPVTTPPAVRHSPPACCRATPQAAPVQIIVGTVLIVLLLGWAGLVGIIFMGLSVPINASMGRRMGRLRAGKMPWADKRVKLCVEVLSG